MALRRKNNRPLPFLLYNRVVLGALIVIFIIFGVSAGELVIKERETHKDLVSARAEKAAVEERKVALEASLASLQSERGKEAVLRRTFDVAKPGEEIIVLLDQEVPQEKEEKQTLWGWISRIFGG